MKQQEIIMLRGLPGSGKSTWAKAQSGYKRVNRDDLRSMLDDGKWSGKNEKTIAAMEVLLVGCLLARGHSVIIDNTHLKVKHQTIWENFAEKAGVKFTIKSFLDIPWKECIIRDNYRDRKVGSQVIINMAKTCDFLNKGE